MMRAPELRTERLILRETALEDFDFMVDLWANRDVVRHIGGQAFSRHDTWLRHLRNHGIWAFLGYGYWTLVERETGRLIGHAGFGDFKRELEPDISGMPEAGWVLSPEFHGLGYATEAMKAAHAWCDEVVKPEQTCCLIDPENTASIHVAKKLGYGHPVASEIGGKPVQVFYRNR